MVLATLQSLPITDILAWVVIGVFLLGVVAGYRERLLARRITAGAWAMFALFWLLYVPFFVFEHRSIIQAVLALIAVPACLLVGYHLYHGRDSLLVLSKAGAVMGVIYLPFETIPLFHNTLIEVVTRQTELAIQALGYSPDIDYSEDGLRNIILFHHETGETFGSIIIFACTGIGSMAIFGGLIAAVDEPLRRRLGALVFTIATIWVLNIVRNVFIALSHGMQWWQYDILIGPVMFMFGLNNVNRVSFFFADRIVSQALAVVVLVIIFWIVLKLLPSLSIIVEDLLYLLTGEEYELDLEGSDGQPVTAPAVGDD